MTPSSHSFPSGLKPDGNTILLTGGRIFGGTGWKEPVWEETVLVHDGLIKAVGKYFDLKPLAIDAEVVDLNGGLLLPGLCDAHLHMAAGGRSLKETNLLGLNKLQIEHALKSTSKQNQQSNDSWIYAFNWEPTRCSLTSQDIEEWLPGCKVFAYQRDLHGCCCSYEVLRQAGITSMTPDPPGGYIGHDLSGRLNGLLYETAIKPVLNLIPEPKPQDQRQCILQAQQYLVELGLTAVSEVLDSGNVEVYQDLDQKDELILYVDGLLRIENWEQSSSPLPLGNRFQLQTIKIFLDGSFGSGTAALNEPYYNVSFSSSLKPDENAKGTLFYSDKELSDTISTVQKAGWKVAMHAIGDCAVEQACRVLRNLSRPVIGCHRIEHLQLIPTNFTSKIAETGIIASIQPVHLLDDRLWLADRIGKERCQNAFIWRSMYEHGVTLAIGSDWPVANPDPLLNLHAAINRCGFRDQLHSDFDMNEALLPHIAIRAATYGWAEAAALQNNRGSITTGLEADFTLVSGVSEDLRDWSNAKVDGTICHGNPIIKKSD